MQYHVVIECHILQYYDIGNSHDRTLSNISRSNPAYTNDTSSYLLVIWTSRYFLGEGDSIQPVTVP